MKEARWVISLLFTLVFFHKENGFQSRKGQKKYQRTLESKISKGKRNFQLPLRRAQQRVQIMIQTSTFQVNNKTYIPCIWQLKQLSCDLIMGGPSVTDENGGGCYWWSFIKWGRTESRRVPFPSTGQEEASLYSLEKLQKLIIILMACPCDSWPVVSDYSP